MPKTHLYPQGRLAIDVADGWTAEWLYSPNGQEARFGGLDARNPRDDAVLRIFPEWLSKPWHDFLSGGEFRWEDLMDLFVATPRQTATHKVTRSFGCWGEFSGVCLRLENEVETTLRWQIEADGVILWVGYAGRGNAGARDEAAVNAMVGSLRVLTVSSGRPICAEE